MAVSTQQLNNAYVEGFTKAAVDAGVSPDKLPQLMKYALDLQLYENNPEAFTSGFNKVAAPWGSILGKLGLVGAGALGLYGVQRGAEAIGDSMADPVTLALRKVMRNIQDSGDPELLRNAPHLLGRAQWDAWRKLAPVGYGDIPDYDKMQMRRTLLARSPRNYA